MSTPERTTVPTAAATMPCVVITADQRSSRTSADAVPEALSLLTHVPTASGFVRTAGDEIQGVLTSARAATSALAVLLRDGRWHVGIGLGSIELPLPDDTRAARGTAFLAAREAVESSSTGRSRPRARAGADADPTTAAALEAALWLWESILAQRTSKGWEVFDLLADGLTHGEAAERLGVAQSAVTQRAGAARLTEGGRGDELVTLILNQHLQGHPLSPPPGREG